MKRFVDECDGCHGPQGKLGLVSLLFRLVRLPGTAWLGRSARARAFFCQFPWLVIALCPAVTVGANENEVGLRSQLKLMLATHCYDCHDADVQEGGLDLEALPWAPANTDNFRHWVKVLDKVERAEMPPTTSLPPPADLRDQFVKGLHQDLLDFSTRNQAERGRTVYRRLNRVEYTHTLQDLLDVGTPLIELLPQDGTADGFDTIGSALDLSVSHLERYMEAADLALQQATITNRSPPTQKTRTDYEETWHDWNHGFQNSQWSTAEDGRLAIRWGGGGAAFGGLRAWQVPVPNARYRFRVRARAMLDRDTASAKAGDKIRTAPRIIAKVGTSATEDRTNLVFDHSYVELSPDEYREFEYEAYIPAGRTFYIAPYRIVPETLGERAMVGGICAVVDWVEIEGPLYEGQWPPSGHRLLYGTLPLEPVEAGAQDIALRVASNQPEADAWKLIANFLPKVFRRPVSTEEVDLHFELFHEQLQEGRYFDEALRAAYKMALTSPQFLFLQEQPGRLNDYAIAARLSYGLWSSFPDDELTQLAGLGELSDPTTLREQTERMLTSPKAKRFIKNFLGGWLNLRDIDFTQPDTKLYPEFEDYLQQCMVAESEGFFEELLKDNESARNIVDSDFAMLNERLAEHYGIQGVTGPELRRVLLPPHSHRGGFITQGAVLKVSANGTTTSPIVRGAYLLDRILGTPPEPPPKNVPSVEPDIRGTTTIRAQLDKHRNQPACAGCHAKLDPPGFALENYDVTGRWRTHYRAIPESANDKIVKIPGLDVRHYTDGLPVDASYTMADGRSFQHIDEFKEIVLSDAEQIARCFVMKLITYLTGATLEFADRGIVDEIMSSTKSTEHGLRDLVHEVIQSRLFTHK